MTALDGGGGAFFPEINSVAANFSPPGGEVFFLLDADGEKLGFIVQAPKAGTLHKVHFLTGTVTEEDDLKVSFQGIDADTGKPDETADQFRVVTLLDTNDNATLSTGIMTDDGTDTGAARTVTKGERLAIVIEFNSYTDGNLNIAGRGSGIPFHTNGMNYCTHKTAGAWGAHTAQPIVALEYSDGSFAWLPMNPGAVARTVSATYNNTSTPDERGNIIRVAAPMQVTGLWAVGIFGADVELVLYDSDGTTPLMTCSIDKDLAGGIANPCLYAPIGSTTVTLAKDTNYRMAVKPTSASGITIYSEQYGSAARLDQASGGSSIHQTTRTDAGAWSETTTNRYLCGVLTSGYDDGAGGGGGGGVSGSRIFTGM